MSKQEIIVFTNGCFEILHKGHIYCLREAKKLGDKLIVGLNSDRSFKEIKMRDPVINEQDRKFALENLKCVDKVIIFDELRPDNLIKEIKPNILVKGSDWCGKLEIEEEILKEFNGKIIIIHRLPNYSTTNLLCKMLPNKSYFGTHIEIVYKLHNEYQKILQIVEYIKKLNNHKILICGNGGSAAEAQHLAAELMNINIKAIAITTDSSVLTSISNDYSYDQVFARQIYTLADKDDIVILLTTSGTSTNIINAVQAAVNQKCLIISLTGAYSNNIIEEFSNIIIKVPSYETTIIQEIHLIIIHEIYTKLMSYLNNLECL